MDKWWRVVFVVVALALLLLQSIVLTELLTDEKEDRALVEGHFLHLDQQVQDQELRLDALERSLP